jgi:GlpG protein
MRQLATLSSAEEAQTFADYLFSLKIDTQLQREGEGWAVWVRDEDQLPQARRELEEFQRDPAGKHFLKGARAAQVLRRKVAREEERLRRREERLRRKEAEQAPEDGPDTHRSPLTFTLIALSVAVFFLSDFGRQRYSILPNLFITAFHPNPDKGQVIEWTPGLVEIQHGELWRLVTPIFIHFDLLHIGFNMALLFSLGRQVEIARGSWRFAALVLALAALSNPAAYGLAHLSWGDGHLDIHSSPNFGGMSGVLYGLFGYIWMKGHYQPQLGLAVSPMTIFFMLAFFILCLTGEMGSISNMAHLAGLLAGLFIAYGPVWWRSWRRRLT